MTEEQRDAALVLKQLTMAYTSMAETGTPANRLRIRWTHVTEAASRVMWLAEQEERRRKHTTT